MIKVTYSRILFLIGLLILLAVETMKGQEQENTPFYIVDGYVGVLPHQLPPDEYIDRLSYVDPEDAVFTYGERASGGAVIIVTLEDFDYTKYLRGELDIADEKDESDTFVYVIVYGSIFLFFVIIFFLGWVYDKMKAVHLAPEYVPDWHDVDSYHATFFKTVKFWYLAIISSVLLMMFGFLLSLPDMLAIFFCLPILCIMSMVWICVWSRKFRIIVDDFGIRGLFKNAEKKWRDNQPNNIEFCISWDQIYKIKMVTRGQGKYSYDALAIYRDSVATDPDMIISLYHAPTIRLIDAIKYFSFRNNKTIIFEKED